MFVALDERGYKILKMIVDNPTITGVQIEKEMDLSRKQLSYSLEKINYYLLDNGFSNIERLRTGKFVVQKEVIDAFKSKQLNDNLHTYIYVEYERILLITLLLLERKEELSVNHFTSIFKVSKNTVISDIRKAQHILREKYDLEILYNRQKGYYIVGKEYEKRILMVRVIRELLKLSNGNAIIHSVLEIDEQKLLGLRSDVEEVERKTQVRFIDERIKEIPYILYFDLLRIESKKYLDVLPEEYQHIKPAVYRIRYQYHIEGNVLNMILPQHGYLHEIIKHTISPLEEFIGHKIPDEELAYITILFGGWLTKEGRLDILEEKKKAIVVCTNGVSISNFLFINLKEIFPEFEFIKTLSVREFQTYSHYYDIVFTTVYLDTNKPQFLVRPIMSELDLQNIRKNVFGELMNVPMYEIKSSSLLKIVEEYADIIDRKGLVNALKSYLGETTKQETEVVDFSSVEVSLKSLLPASNIIISNNTLDWEEAIQLASKPLLDNNCIVPKYVDHMIKAIKTEKPIWLIADGLLLAHAGVDEGVKHLGMSLLKLPQKINVNGYMEANIIIVLATPNREIHLKALYSLIDITEDKKDFAKLKNAESLDEIIKIVSKERN